MVVYNKKGGKHPSVREMVELIIMYPYSGILSINKQLISHTYTEHFTKHTSWHLVQEIAFEFGCPHVPSI